MTIPLNGTKTGRAKYREDEKFPANNISCNIPDKRKRAFGILAKQRNTTVGLLTREANEQFYGAELDAIEATLS